MKEQLRKFITDNFLFGRPIELSDDDSLQDAGIIDSTGVLELVTHIEETYGIQVRDSELLPENLDSINRLAGFLSRKREEGGIGACAPQPA
jgi:acyl carrier protein